MWTLNKIVERFSGKISPFTINFEPGSAFAWRTGVLVSSVVDIVENHG
jgi:carboxynorspermidine decarboxylase